MTTPGVVARLAQQSLDQLRQATDAALAQLQTVAVDAQPEITDSRNDRGFTHTLIDWLDTRLAVLELAAGVVAPDRPVDPNAPGDVPVPDPPPTT